MTPEFKARWIAALRGGAYQQGRYVLKDENNRYCCLGVALDLKDPNKWAPLDKFSCAISTRRSNWGPHPAGMAGAQLSHELELPGEAAGQLARLNDRQGYDFCMIADWIEKNL